MTHILTQIWRLVLQPEVWRFVGFASAIVGLLCYALSSSFNHLFGNWNLWKIILYTVFSLIISLMILYANIWKSSTSLRSKAHTAFLVLTITSVYSFFFDKVVNGKPDAFSLISCASFAIMSLSLSKQTQFGFEIDLLYFFLGCLIVQLMKISLQLLILGAGFSYSLIILRSSFSSIESFDRQNFSSIDDTIENESFDRQREKYVLLKFDSLLLRDLKKCIVEIEKENLNLIERLMELVKEYNHEKSELHLLYKCHYVMDTLSSRKFQNLNNTVKLMVTFGFKKECYDVYSSWRKERLADKISGLPALNAYERDTMFEMHVDEAMTIFYPIEREISNPLCNPGTSLDASSCFVEVCHEATSQLLRFADAIASGNSSKSRLFKMLDIFEHLCNLIPKFQSLFLDSTLLNEAIAAIAVKNKLGEAIREAIAVKNKLGEAIRDLFMEMPGVIFRVPAGNETILTRDYQITFEVMSYVSLACTSREKLEQILQAYPKVDNEVEVSSFLKQMKHIMETLPKKLKDKLTNFKDPALRYIFMVNNRSHIEAINPFSESETIFGNDWFQDNKEKIQQNIELYEKVSWNQVLDFLKLEEDFVKLENNVKKELLKEKIHLFNTHFEEICRFQSDWFIYDNKLREEIISSVKNVLFRAYGPFLNEFQDIFGKQAYKYIKYGLLQIGERLDQLFQSLLVTNQNQNI